MNDPQSLYVSINVEILKIIKMSKPTIELKSTPFTEVIELERIVTPDSEKRVDHIFVRRMKICKRHPEGFATEEIARFDIAWPEEPKEEIKESTKSNEEIEFTTK